VQVAGTGQQIGSAPMRDALARSPSLQRCFLRYSKTFALQTAFTALANAKATVDERLARWLLMAHDRAIGDALNLTHEFLALMLGVRRAGVTTAIGHLEDKNLIFRTRGVLQMRDRQGLERFANGFYGVSDAEQHRLTGWSGKLAHI
jgi:CRP-like cAMP-binding protein